jgi:hypothetical protein
MYKLFMFDFLNIYQVLTPVTAGLSLNFKKSLTPTAA